MNQHRCSTCLCFSFVRNSSEVVNGKNLQLTGGESYRQDFVTRFNRLRCTRNFGVAVSYGRFIGTTEISVIRSNCKKRRPNIRLLDRDFADFVATALLRLEEIFLKQGKTLSELGRELQRQRLNRQDFLADTRSLTMQSDSLGSTLRLSIDDQTRSFTVGEIAHQQIASRLNIPFRYYQKMQVAAPELLDKNVNTWFAQSPERRMIRVLDGTMSVLSCPTAIVGSTISNSARLSFKSSMI